VTSAGSCVGPEATASSCVLDAAALLDELLGGKAARWSREATHEAQRSARVVRPGPPGLAPEAEPQIGTRALLGFIVGKERYALPLSSIREILRPLPLTEVPRARPA